MAHSDLDSHSDFRLPGSVSHADSNARLITTMSFSYSGIQNPRRLECYLHAPWGQCLTDLIDDLGPETFLIAQHKLSPFDRVSIQAWRKQKEEEKKAIQKLEQQRNANRLGKGIVPSGLSATSASGSHVSPAPKVEVGGTGAKEGTEEEDADVLADVSFETLPDKRTEEKSPDFSILKALKFLNRLTGDVMTVADFPENPADWDIVRVALSRVLVVVELKPAPSRHSEDEHEFQTALDRSIHRAGHQAIRQAERAFAADEKLEALVALAVSGEWWMWRLIRREEAPPLKTEQTDPPPSYLSLHAQPAHIQTSSTSILPSVAIQPVLVSEGSGRGQRGAAVNYAEWNSDGEEEEEKVSYNRRPAGSGKGKKETPAAPRPRTVLQHAKPGYSDQAEASIFDVVPLPAGEWSNFMRLSTPRSNQALYILHYFIKHGRLPEREQTQTDNNDHLAGPSRSGGISRKRASESTSDEQAPKKQRLVAGDEDEELTSDGCVTPPSDD
ncbi:hypothetical protein NLJ89_g9254 [Agrocybe chaxingu]|uniref:Uncharacterized protein n=1 Tax=Agrocybe chaxingu TaxID=84603 RepID=A0A9W8JTE7_9AGAR|nr:hypothetical protein NLJ89_g9254 [Agrocybe chaxingu]